MAKFHIQRFCRSALNKSFGGRVLPTVPKTDERLSACTIQREVSPTLNHRDVVSRNLHTLYYRNAMRNFNFMKNFPRNYEIHLETFAEQKSVDLVLTAFDHMTSFP